MHFFPPFCNLLSYRSLTIQLQCKYWYKTVYYQLMENSVKMLCIEFAKHYYLLYRFRGELFPFNKYVLYIFRFNRVWYPRQTTHIKFSILTKKTFFDYTTNKTELVFGGNNYENWVSVELFKQFRTRNTLKPTLRTRGLLFVWRSALFCGTPRREERQNNCNKQSVMGLGVELNNDC